MIRKLKETAKYLKTQIEVLIVAYGDRRTPVFAKIIIGITAGYLLGPIDLIPDFIPVLGILDDIIIVPALIAWSIKLIPPDVLDEARQKVKASPQTTKKRNWIAAGVIILIWLTALYYLLTLLELHW